MGISVKEALGLDCFKGVRVIAGESGLDRLIKRVSVFESPDLDGFDTVMGDGDFYISSMYAIKDDSRVQLDVLKVLVDTNSSGLCLIDLYMDDLSYEIKEFADRWFYPVLMISDLIPYAEVITQIMNAIIKNKEETITEMTIRSLLQPNITKQQVYETATSINSRFGSNVGALYLKVGDGENTDIKSLKKSYKEKERWSFIKYDGGILVIISFDNHPKERINMQLDQVIEDIHYYFDDYRLGISRLHSGLDNLNICIREALLACEMGTARTDKIVYYNNLGVYRLLMLIKDEPELKRFHDEIIGPLKSYDRQNGTSLVKTAISYVDNDGDIAKTADSLYQHHNTVRYRIGRIREILDMKEMNGSFFEKLSIAVKIHRILGGNL